MSLDKQGDRVFRNTLIGLALAVAIGVCSAPRPSIDVATAYLHIDDVLKPEEAKARIVRYLEKDEDFKAVCAQNRKDLHAEATTWAVAILDAIEEAGAFPGKTLIKSILAVIKKESSFHANPATWHLKEEFQAKMKEQRAKYKDQPLIHDQLEAVEKEFGPKFSTAQNEAEVEKLLTEIRNRYHLDLLAYVPLVGQSAANAANKLTQETRGAMQVNVNIAQAYFEEKCKDPKRPDPKICNDTSKEAVATKLWWLRPNIEVGVHLLTRGFAAYGDSEANLPYVFAGYNAGPYAPRNAAFQWAINELVADPQKTLVLDGDLLGYDSDGNPLAAVSKTERVILEYCLAQPGFQRCEDPKDLRQDLLHGQFHDFLTTDTAQEIRSMYKDSKKDFAPREMMPESSGSVRTSHTAGPADYAKSAVKFYKKVDL